MQRSILSTVEISMCSLEMEFSQAVKLSSVARKRTQVNFKILNILLMMLSNGEQNQQGVNEHKYLLLYFCLELDSFFLLLSNNTNPSCETLSYQGIFEDGWRPFGCLDHFPNCMPRLIIWNPFSAP